MDFPNLGTENSTIRIKLVTFKLSKFCRHSLVVEIFKPPALWKVTSELNISFKKKQKIPLMKSSNNQRMNDEEKGRKINEEIYHNIQEQQRLRNSIQFFFNTTLGISHKKILCARESSRGVYLE